MSRLRSEVCYRLIRSQSWKVPTRVSLAIPDEASESVSAESIYANVLETALSWNWGLCLSLK